VELFYLYSAFSTGKGGADILFYCKFGEKFELYLKLTKRGIAILK
jgi:hypothetical protein